MEGLDQMALSEASLNADARKMNRASDSAASLANMSLKSNGAAHDNTDEAKALHDLLERLTSGGSEEERGAAAADIAKHVQAAGAASMQATGLLDMLKAAIEDSSSALAREGALLVFSSLCQVVGKPAEPFLVPLLGNVLGCYCDKVAPVRVAAEAAGKALVELLSPLAVKVVLPTLLDNTETKKHWQVKTGALTLLSTLTRVASEEMARSLPDTVPALTAAMADAKRQVQVAAGKVLSEACNAVGNRDIEPFIPALVSSIARPAEVPDTVHKLSATTFVQAVEAPTLSIMVPLLLRGLRERATAIKRKSCLIIDNMAKLVDNPNDAAVFLPRLLPGVEKVKDEVSDPECRGVATKAHATLLRLVKDVDAEPPKAADAQTVLKALREAVGKAEVDGTTLAYVAKLACPLIDRKIFDKGDWVEVVMPYLGGVLGKEGAQAAAKGFLDRCFEASIEKVKDEDIEEGEDLCNCEFSLAYGAKILLNNATLHLKRGKRYGLCGPNGVGKSTLMRSIANGQLDGFPPKEELRTVYVEHDIDSEASEMSVVEYVYSDPILQDASHPGHKQVEEVLGSVGFTDAMQAQPVASLSGGWKMKLALARAMLMKADIMLLDEPTNHLDVKNVKWLQDYLISLTDVTSMIVSHDSGFLDAVCSNIIHYEGRKLRLYRGNLAEFVKQRPEAKAYYELASADLKFILPEPGFLEGIKSKDKPILKMTHVSFKYPTAPKNTLEDVSIFCSLNSRVAVIGPNGAGKSTMIKVLTGEMEPTTGTVWKHPNMRFAYVAQHAFHHIEQHLDKTPNQYIQWRYATGEDRENLVKVGRVVTDAEQAAMEKLVLHDGVKKQVDKLLSRRKLKKSYEYEVRWAGAFSHPEHDTWLTRDQLIDMGFEKLVNELDMKEASRAGLVTRPLTQKVVEKHLEDLGIEPEFGTHSHMRGLSGGQKVKVVLAAAMWLNPHIVVLDEPTNYLDRDALGALATAIKEYGGGVVMISHNSEFTGALCKEQWHMVDGRLQVSGQSEAAANAEKLEWKRQEEMTDALGNVVKIKAPKKKLSNKEKKQRERVRKAKLARGEEVSDSEEDE